MREAFIGMLGAVLGAAISLGGTIYIAEAQFQKVAERERIKKQHETIVDMANALAYAGRINGLVQGHMLQIVAAEQLNKACIVSAANGRERSKDCDMNSINKEMNQFNQEIFERTARYQHVRVNAKLVFCDATRGVLNSETLKQEWWKITNEESEKLINIMNAEVGCKSF